MANKLNRQLFGLFAFGLMFAYWWLVETYLPIPHAFEFAVVCTCFILGSILALYMAYIYYQSAAIASEMEHGTTPVHGQPLGIFGTLRPMQQTLSTPIRQTPCVLYYYKVTPGGGTSPEQLAEPIYRFNETICASFVMAPCYVETDHGPIQLFGFPTVGTVSPEKATTIEEFQRVRERIEATDFEKVDSPGYESMNEVFNPVHVREDGSMQWHVHLKGSLEKIFPETIDPENAWKKLPCIAEVHVPADIAVCVYGIYDENRRALHSNEHQTYITLFAATPQEMREDATKWMGRLLVLGISGMVLSHVVIIFAVLYQQNPITSLFNLLHGAP